MPKHAAQPGIAGIVLPLQSMTLKLLALLHCWQPGRPQLPCLCVQLQMAAMMLRAVNTRRLNLFALLDAMRSRQPAACSQVRAHVQAWVLSSNQPGQQDLSRGP